MRFTLSPRLPALFKSRRIRLGMLVAIHALGAGHMSLAQPVTVTTSTSLSSADTVFPGTSVPVGTAQVMVQNAVLTISGDVSIASLSVGTGGVITHPSGHLYDADPGPGVEMVGGFHLHTSGDVSVFPGGTIDVSGRGQAGGQGPGAGTTAMVNQCASGAGYGGSGGVGTNTIGGGTYGSFSQPVDLGSGGGSADSSMGKAGGGTVRISVGGTLTNEGTIIADGPPYDGTYSGGGSGGSIWISAATITGAGSIHANGGGGNACGTGGGGGGRVALYGNLNGYSGQSQARGSTGSGAGTVYRAPTGQQAQLIFDNGGSPSPSALSVPLTVPAGVDVFVRNGASLTHAAGNVNGLQIQVAGNLTIDSGGFIDVAGRGLVTGPGAGASASVNQCASGGGYGGSGGAGTNTVGGATYGSFSEPIDLGSGGGSSDTAAGKRGGGAVRVTVGGVLTVNGVISADGPAYDGSYSGGGSGGSIWIVATSVSGTGTIHANGGGGTACGNGAGGGGRVAVYGDLSAFTTPTSSIQARGASGTGAGTVYRSQVGQPAQLVFDNGGASSQSALSAPLVVPAGVDVFVRNGAGLSHAAGSTQGLRVQVADNLTIESGGSIDVTGRGYPGGQGPGSAGTAAINQCSAGAGYGGAGGAGTSVPGGAVYGSMTQPTSLGSGGGNADTVPGRAGGGAVHLTVGGTLEVNGRIVADGPAYDGSYSGGGSGGSIWITAAAVTGSGMIHANGGGGNACGNGAGGGGRLAIYACTVTTPSPSIAAHSGGAGAAEGSLYSDATALAVIPMIVGPSQSCPGATIALTAETVHASSFQWRRNGVAIVDGPGVGGSSFAGSQSQVLTVSNVSASDGRAEITVVVTNSCGHVISSPPLHLICSGDFNCSGTLTVQDIFDFLAAWFNADQRADFNGVGGLGVQDIFDFLNAWFAGC